MQSIAEAAGRCRSVLSELYDEGEAMAVCDYLFSNAYGINRMEILKDPDSVFRFEEKFVQDLESLKMRKPVQYITGFTWFSGLKIKTEPGVLIPRPETEELLEWVYQRINYVPENITDHCTGSGCIALNLKKRFPVARIYATDVSEVALEQARESEKLNFDHLDIQWISFNILEKTLPGWDLELVVSNPPYIPKSEYEKLDAHVRESEPQLALFVDDSDPLIFYKIIIDSFKQKQGKDLFFEIHPPFAALLQEYCEGHYLNCFLEKDMSGSFRFAHIFHS